MERGVKVLSKKSYESVGGSFSLSILTEAACRRAQMVLSAMLCVQVYSFVLLDD